MSRGAGAAAVPPPGAPSKQLTLAGMASALDLEKQVEPKRLSMPRRNHPTKTVAQLIVHTHKDPAKAVIDAQPRSCTSLSQVEDRENGSGVPDQNGSETATEDGKREWNGRMWTYDDERPPNPPDCWQGARQVCAIL